jgi:hypothetical protein
LVPLRYQLTPTLYSHCTETSATVDAFVGREETHLQPRLTKATTEDVLPIRSLFVWLVADSWC